MSKPIVILALPKHDDNFTSTSYQLAEQFAKSRPVLYVSHPYSWTDLLKGFKSPKMLKRFWATFTGGNIELSEHVHLQILILPLVIPINWLPEGKLYNWLNKINHSIVARAIKRAVRRLGIGEYDFINSHDYYFAQIHQLLNNKGKYIYQCLDPIIKAYSARHGHRLEQEAAAEADLVISTSPTLREKMSAYNPNSILVPNASNFSLCNRALKPETNTIPAIDSLEGLKFGYIGNIERRIDYSLLINVFTARPDWQLVMVGPIDESFIPNEFFELKNLTLLPPVPHHKVPEVLKSLDIAIIPFVCDEVSAQIYPLKMYEYLASGKPVITTDFNPEVIGALASAVNIANDADQFFKQVDLINSLDDESLLQHRVNVARQNDWSQRSDMILNLI